MLPSHRPWLSATALGLLASLAVILFRSQDPAPAISPSPPALAADSAPPALVLSAPDSPAHMPPASPASDLSGGDDKPLDQAARVLDTLPGGRFRDELLALAPPLRTRTLLKLSALAVPREDHASLCVTSAGDLFYACALHHSHPPDASPGASGIPLPPKTDRIATATTVPVAAPVPISKPPIRHSKPGSTKIIYLDFNGHIITGTHWNTLEGVSSYAARPYDIDGQSSTFSDAEQAAIIQVWERVSEDFAPFDIDVTTEEPASFTRTTARALITKNTDANGLAMPHDTAGGVAFLDVFDHIDYVALYSPALIYVNSYADDMAEVVSHEIGHNLGLSHDGRTGEEYYWGHGSGATSWAPIMGAAYNRNVTQWSKGGYSLANNPQDDFAIISALTGYRQDEAGDTLQTAAPLPVTDGDTQLAGLLLREADQDLYVFDTAAGAINFSVTTYQASDGSRGVNADVALALLDSDGRTVATSNPADSPDATLDYAAAAGTYYLRLTPAGTGSPQASSATGYTSYGSAGQYTVTGNVVIAPPTMPPVITSATSASAAAGFSFGFVVTATNAPTRYDASGLPAGLSLNSSSGRIGGRPTALGTFVVALQATNSAGVGLGTLTIQVADAPPAIISQTTDPLFLAPGAAASLQVSTLSPNGTPSHQWKHNGLPIPGATGPTLDIGPASYARSGYYQVLVTNPVGTTASDVVFVHVAPVLTDLLSWGESPGGLAPPADLNRIMSLSAGNRHCLALKTDGKVVAWGDNTLNQSTVPVTLSQVVAVAAGHSHSLALKSTGLVIAWGSTPAPPADLTRVVAIAAGGGHSLALKSDGTVTAWGSAGPAASVPGGLAEVVAIAAGSEHSLALRADGTVTAWGKNLAGQTTVPPGLGDVVAIAAGRDHSLALKADGSVVAWGLDASGQSTVPPDLSGVISVAAGQNHSLAFRDDGTVVAWGSDSHGQIDPPPASDWIYAIAAGGNRSHALLDATAAYIPVIDRHPQNQTAAEGQTATLSVSAQAGGAALSYQWRRNSFPVPDATGPVLVLTNLSSAKAGAYDVVVSSAYGSVTSDPATVVVNALPSISGFSARRRPLVPGQPLLLQVTATSTLALSYQWYHNNRPIPGANGPSYSLPSAGEADSGSYWVAVGNTVGTRRSPVSFVTVSPATTAVGVWGDNTHGQRNVPATLVRTSRLATQGSHILALQSDGTVAAWGRNDHGQSTVPAALANVVAVAAGLYHSIALKSDGTVTGWGNATYTTPPAGLGTVVALAAGGLHSLALRQDGTVAAWGYNGQGQCLVPPNLSDVMAIAAGGNHSLALKTDGTVVAWGSDTHDQSSVPVSLADIIAISGGATHSLALKTDGSVVAWGTGAPAAPPAGLADIIALAAGGAHSLALDTTGAVTAWGGNTQGQTTPPSGLADVFTLAAGGNLSAAARAMPTTWTVFQRRHFTTIQLANPAVSAATADPDADGLANLLEYALGLDPAAPTGSAGLPAVFSEDGSLTFSYIRRKDATDLVYTVEVSSDLATWRSGAGHTEEITVTPLDATREQVVVRDMRFGDAAPRFMRLKVHTRL